MIYPPNFPYKIILGPLKYKPYNNSNLSVLSPSVKIICTDSSYKNFVENRELNCKFKKSLKGWNNTYIKHFKLKEGGGISIHNNLSKEFNLGISSNKNYSIRAYYEGGYISLTLFEKNKIYSKDSYNELRFKRIGLLGAFIVFSMAVLTNFIKNILEIIKLESD